MRSDLVAVQLYEINSLCYTCVVCDDDMIGSSSKSYRPTKNASSICAANDSTKATRGTTDAIERRHVAGAAGRAIIRGPLRKWKIPSCKCYVFLVDVDTMSWLRRHHAPIYPFSPSSRRADHCTHTPLSP
jgi:hypothetical protein